MTLNDSDGSPDMTDADQPIAIACPICHRQVEKTLDWLRANEQLACPSCGHGMAAGRAAVMRHIETVRRAMAEVVAR